MDYTILQNLTPSEPSVQFVCILGVGIVFSALILLVGVVWIMNMITGKPEKHKSIKGNTTDTVSKKIDITENKQEIIAAVCAAIAEDSSTDISSIRVLSFKKLD